MTALQMISVQPIERMVAKPGEFNLKKAFGRHYVRRTLAVDPPEMPGIPDIGYRTGRTVMVEYRCERWQGGSTKYLNFWIDEMTLIRLP